jgi:hypothetical protein
MALRIAVQVRQTPHESRRYIDRNQTIALNGNEYSKRNMRELQMRISSSVAALFVAIMMMPIALAQSK